MIIFFKFILEGEQWKRVLVFIEALYVPSLLPMLSYLILRVILEGRYYYHFTDKETEVQRNLNDMSNSI